MMDGCPTLGERELLLMVTLLAVLIPVGLVWGADKDEYVTLFRDDFDAKDPHWGWSLNGVGTINLRDGYAFLTMTKTDSFAKAQLYDTHKQFGSPWLYVGMEVRLRCSDDNMLESDIGGGFRFWGLYDYGTAFYDVKDWLVFICFSPESDPDLAGFWAYAMVDKKTVFRQRVTSIDMREWHTYTILWEEGNGTFLVGGEVVAATDMAPSNPQSISLDYETSRFGAEGPYKVGDLWFTPVGLEQDGWIQVDYVHVFMPDEKFQEMDTEISGLLDQALSLINELEQKGENTSHLVTEYAKAHADWQKDHYLYIEAKPRLERIIDSIGHWDEITAMFAQACECIEALMEKGDTRNENVCRAFYSNAEGAWEECDYERTQDILGSIIAKCPEPFLFTLLVLVLLPAFLRGRPTHR